MTVIGLDTAAKKWHAVSSTGTVGFCSELKGAAWKDPDGRRAELCRTFGLWLREQLVQSYDDHIFICCEEPLALTNGKTTRLLGLAGGALWSTAYTIGAFSGQQGGPMVEWVWADVSHWKRTICGNGNIDKDGIRHHVLDKGWVSEAQIEVYEAEIDLYDARCLLDFGLLWLALGEKPPTL